MTVPIALLALLAAVNPAAVAVSLRAREDRRLMAGAAAGAAVLAVVLAGASDAILSALDVTPGTFRVAAGVVLAAAALSWLIAGAWNVPDGTDGAGWQSMVVPLLVPLLLTPPLVMVSISAGADRGVALVALGAAVALALAWLAATANAGSGLVWGAAMRFVAMAAAVAAFAMVADGVKTV